MRKAVIRSRQDKDVQEGSRVRRGIMLRALQSLLSRRGIRMLVEPKGFDLGDILQPHRPVKLKKRTPCDNYEAHLAFKI